jgi:sugar phosphate isomerase/epimerase
MRLSLSVRIAESVLNKKEANRSLEQLADLAVNIGYPAICLRASQVGIHTPLENITAADKVIRQRQLTVSMITGDFPIPANNDHAPDALRNITPYLDLADLLNTKLIRIGMKNSADIVWAQRSADEARERGINLAHQSHTLSLFETVDESVEVLKRVGRPNFGLIFEPANLDLCGQNYGPDTLERFQPWLFNVYVQNHIKNPNGAIVLNTWIHGPAPYDPIRLQDSGGINFPDLLNTLNKIGYDGFVTVHQAFAGLMEPEEAAQESFGYLVSIAKFQSSV